MLSELVLSQQLAVKFQGAAYTDDPTTALASGVDVVSNKRKLSYPQGRHGYCGDAYNEKKWDVPGTTQSTYVQGQVGG